MLHMLSNILTVGPYRSIAAGWLCSFPWWKEPKIKSAATLLCALWPLRCKAGKTWGGGLLPHLRTTDASGQHSEHPCRRTWPALFYLLSPEAARLTGHRSFLETPHSV